MLGCVQLSAALKRWLEKSHFVTLLCVWRSNCAKNAAAAAATAEPGSSTQHQFAKKEILFLIVHAVVVSQKY